MKARREFEIRVEHWRCILEVRESFSLRVMCLDFNGLVVSCVMITDIYTFFGIWMIMSNGIRPESDDE